jgi:hypothetical protein
MDCGADAALIFMGFGKTESKAVVCSTVELFSFLLKAVMGLGLERS